MLWFTQLARIDYFLGAGRLGDDFRYRGLNPMKGGIVYSNFVTTVSPSHADEALYGDGGSGLGGTLKEHQDKFRGVRNGVDYFVWNRRPIHSFRPRQGACPVDAPVVFVTHLNRYPTGNHLSR